MAPGLGYDDLMLNLGAAVTTEGMIHNAGSMNLAVSVMFKDVDPPYYCQNNTQNSSPHMKNLDNRNESEEIIGNLRNDPVEEKEINEQKEEYTRHVTALRRCMEVMSNEYESQIAALQSTIQQMTEKHTSEMVTLNNKWADMVSQMDQESSGAESARLLVSFIKGEHEIRDLGSHGDANVKNHSDRSSSSDSKGTIQHLLATNYVLLEKSFREQIEIIQSKLEYKEEELLQARRELMDARVQLEHVRGFKLHVGESKASSSKDEPFVLSRRVSVESGSTDCTTDSDTVGLFNEARSEVNSDEGRSLNSNDVEYGDSISPEVPNITRSLSPFMEKTTDMFSLQLQDIEEWLRDYCASVMLRIEGLGIEWVKMRVALKETLGYDVKDSSHILYALMAAVSGALFSNFEREQSFEMNVVRIDKLSEEDIESRKEASMERHKRLRKALRESQIAEWRKVEPGVASFCDAKMEELAKVFAPCEKRLCAFRQMEVLHGTGIQTRKPREQQEDHFVAPAARLPLSMSPLLGNEDGDEAMKKFVLLACSVQTLQEMPLIFNTSPISLIRATPHQSYNPETMEMVIDELDLRGIEVEFCVMPGFKVEEHLLSHAKVYHS